MAATKPGMTRAIISPNREEEEQLVLAVAFVVVIVAFFA
jgi:hypothetical protein